MSAAPVPNIERLRIVATGLTSDATLCDALAKREDVELVDLTPTVADAAQALRQGVDAVLLSTDGADVPHKAMAAIRQDTSAPIILLANDASPALFEAALGAGVADVLVAPHSPESVLFAIKKVVRLGSDVALRAAPEPARGKVITVFSPKGGTGKTAVATNVAAAIAHYESRKVLLVDLDLQFGDTAIMLGLEPTKTVYDLTTAPGELDAHKLHGYTTRHGAGIDVLAAPVRPEQADAVTDEKVVSILEVARDAYDITIVDTSPFFYGAMLATLEPTDELLLLCGQDVPTLKNVRLSVNTLELLGFPTDHLNLVMNRCNPAVGVSSDEVEVVLGREIAFELPEDPAVQLAVNRGTPAVLAASESPFARAAREMAHALVPAFANGAPAADEFDQTPSWLRRFWR